MQGRASCLETKFQLNPALMRRRHFLQAGGLLLAGLAAGARGAAEQTASKAGASIPLKIGIRAASLKMAGNLGVIKVAAGLPGIMGVELQVTSGRPNLHDGEMLRRYKKEADRWALRIPTLAGVFEHGVELGSAAAADNIRLAVRAAEFLGSSALLLAFFGKQAPDMTKEASYGPLVTMLRGVAPCAAEAGVALGLENSLNPADNAKLVDLVGHPAVRVYYDPHNMATYGHAEQAIPGIKQLGKERICAVHVKNGDKRIGEPGPIDWAAAFRALNEIGYDGWYIYETSHANLEAARGDIEQNNNFLRQHTQMPA